MNRDKRKQLEFRIGNKRVPGRGKAGEEVIDARLWNNLVVLMFRQKLKSYHFLAESVIVFSGYNEGA